MMNPIVFNELSQPVAILENAYDIIVSDEMLSTTRGYETLQFRIPSSDEKSAFIQNERKIEVDNRMYVIKLVDSKKENGSVIDVSCDALWYDLNDGEPKTHVSEVSQTPRQAIDEQLEGTGWTSGIVQPTTPHAYTLDEPNSSLYNLRRIHSIFGGELWFDTKNQVVNLYNEMGSKVQQIFSYERNVSGMRRMSDTRELATRFTLLGKDSEGNTVDISSINGGLAYLENYQWYDSQGLPRKLKPVEKSDDRFNVKENMRDYMIEWLEEYSKPIVSYDISISLFDRFPNLGDYVYILDREWNLGSWIRVVARKHNFSQSYLSLATLGSLKKDLSSVIIG